MYKGVIVEESLTDNRLLNRFKIVGVQITTQDDPSERWHLYTVLANREDMDVLAHALKPEKWYAHFWEGNEVIAVFPGHTFTFQYDHPQTWADAIAYGRRLGIPDEQLDFVIDP